HVERAVAVAEPIAVRGAVVVDPAAIVEAVAPEPETEIERVRSADPPLGRQAGGIADDEAQPELSAVADLGRMSRASDGSEQRRREKRGEDCPFHGGYSRHENSSIDSFP